MKRLVASLMIVSAWWVWINFGNRMVAGPFADSSACYDYLVSHKLFQDVCIDDSGR